MDVVSSLAHSTGMAKLARSGCSPGSGLFIEINLRTMPFEPGQSGNPGGRPKADVRLREMAREHTEAALQALVAALDDEKTRVSAAIALLDRGYGKPVQAVGNAEDEVFKMEVSWVKE